MEKILILKDGSSYKIIKEDKKYYWCDGTQFRKNNKEIKEVVKKKEEEAFDNLPDVKEIEKEMEEENKFIKSITERSKRTSKKKGE